MRDKTLIRIARDFRAGILQGRPSTLMCAAVSFPLQGFLSALYGIETEVEKIDLDDANHVFLRLPDGRILDATADQFGLEAVYLGPMPERYR
jgi:hypothetical protein